MQRKASLKACKPTPPPLILPIYWLFPQAIIYQIKSAKFRSALAAARQGMIGGPHTKFLQGQACSLR
jgi:hypothetical protein